MVVTIAQGLRQSCLICMMPSDPYNKDCDLSIITSPIFQMRKLRFREM